MADQLNMTGLTLADSRHANGFAIPPGGQRAAYIPPHLRSTAGGPPGPPAGMDGPPPMMNGTTNGGPWGPPPGPLPQR